MSNLHHEVFTCIENKEDDLYVVWADKPRKDGGTMGIRSSGTVAFDLAMAKRLRDRLDAIIKLHDTEPKPHPEGAE